MKRLMVLMTRNLYWSEWQLTPLGEYTNNTKWGKLRLWCINQHVSPIICWDLTVKKVALCFTATVRVSRGSGPHREKQQLPFDMAGALRFANKTLFLTQDPVTWEKKEYTQYGPWQKKKKRRIPNDVIPLCIIHWVSFFVLCYSASMWTHTSFMLGSSLFSTAATTI